MYKELKAVPDRFNSVGIDWTFEPSSYTRHVYGPQSRQPRSDLTFI